MRTMKGLEFLLPLALVYLAALLAAYALVRLRQPPIVGFLIAGILLGPHGFGLVRDVHVVEVLAEVGVVLLLFTVGLELSLPNLGRLGRLVWTGGTAQVLGTTALATAVGLASGLDLRRSLFLGFLVSNSSTAIILKMLMDRGELHSPHGRNLLGILILQDLAVVPMMLLVNPLAGKGAVGIGGLALLLARLLAVVALLFVAGRVLVPRLLGVIVRARHRELFVVAVLLIVILTALATSATGLSLALGAFLAGLVLSESEYGAQAMADVGPFRDAFSALFFVSIGMLFDVRTIGVEAGAVFGLLAMILFGKPVLGGLPALFMGYGPRIAAVVGLTLAQIGEFSIVLVREGHAAGLVRSDEYQIVLAAAIVSMIVTPMMHELGHFAGGRLARRSRRTPRAAAPAEPPPFPSEKHVLVVGFGHMGETLARVLTRAEVPFRVLDIDSERVRRGQRRHLPIEFGDATGDFVLRRSGIERARAVLVLLSDPRATRQVVRLCRSLAPGVFLLVRTRYLSEIPELSALGADEVVAEEFETSLEIAGRTLRRLGFSLPWVESETDDIRQARHDGFRRFRAPGGSPEGVRRALGGTRVELVSVAPEWPAAGRSLRDLDLRGEGGAIVLAVLREGQPTVTPGGDFQLRGFDQLLMLGTSESLERTLERLQGTGAA